ncbi:ParB/RepB/Spo0J family partition protein [Phascolarctobacterium succinatutens]|uniref:Putative stage 0 sporulation protein J n=1 Tax=Phascolarctobacterium succinatutens CAG:287 TaxID=1263101 RepID=R6X6P3_9FIRM|nr:ParB/RepB/Spo0J family partition protein [Phascolarctobacterium succinatutens]CDD11941.1 putative stage 0 sporulation protein J [Phascolarctobacterium succinatutens CAG:287]
MSKKGGLGKGLGAIFGENTSPAVEKAQEPASAAQELLIKNIAANPYQPRCNFDEEKLQELAASIKEFGVVQPVVVRKKGRSYELVAGERRLRAAGLAGLTKVPAIVKDYDDAKMMEIALIENIQRHDLNPIEEAQGLRRLMQEFKLTQEQTAEKVGRSRSAVTNILRLLNLPEQVQKQIINGVLTMGQAKQLLGLPKPEQMCEVAEAIIANGWSSRMTEEVVRKLKEGKKLKIVRELIEEEAKNKDNKEKKPKREPTENDIFCHDFEQRLVEFLGTKVKVVPKLDEQGRQGGTIHIEYYSAEDLERIYEVLQQGRHEDKPHNGEPKRLNV